VARAEKEEESPEEVTPPEADAADAPAVDGLTGEAIVPETEDAGEDAAPESDI